MANNVALFGRRELEAHRPKITGITASVPAFKVMDGEGNKLFVVDVYLGPSDGTSQHIVRDVPISPIAKELVADIRVPVELERSRQGKFTVTGRSMMIPAGAQLPDGSILKPTYHEVEYNLADLGLLFIADVDYSLEVLQEDATVELQANPDEPLQVVSATDAFGYPILGPDAAVQEELVDPAPLVRTTTRHTKLLLASLGPPGDPEAMKWGVSELQPAIQIVIELVT